jgi:predicted DCC family thiol-disulfide oxidoreductase YuxK
MVKVADDQTGAFPALADRGDPVLVFDGDCGFCSSAARWAAREFHHGERAEAWQLVGSEFLDEHDLSLDDVTEAAWWVDGGGLKEGGHRAVGRALMAGRGLRRMVGVLALTPPFSWLAAGVYRMVVHWRHRLPPGGTPACKVDNPGSSDL